jgi:hypothetical protein
MFLPSRFITRVGGSIHRHELIGGVYEVAFEMGLGAVIYILSFIKIGSSIQKLIGGTDTQSAW